MNGKISRRTVLRGVGTALALPMLDVMMPSSAMAEVAVNAPRRMAFFYVPNGMVMPKWTPKTEGSDFDLSPTLAPLARHREDLLVLSGLTLDGGRSHGDGGGDHARSVASFLTGAHPYKTQGAGIRNGISVDQVAAQQVGRYTPFASLELGTQKSGRGGNCDTGYSCLYTSNISWRNPTTPVPKEVDPRAVFDRLFGDTKPERRRDRQSVLDLAMEEARSLDRRLGTADRRKVDEYLYAVRDIERRIHFSERIEGRQAVSDATRPAGIPSQFDEHIELMLDLIVLAFQTDSTRVLTMMFTNATSNRTYPHLNVGQGHHALSHHEGSEEKQAMISRVNHYHITLYRHLLDRLAEIKEGDGRMLDNCMLLYGCGISDGNRHDHGNLPILLAGGGGGSLTTGRHIRYPKETPLSNLYLSMLGRMGVSDDAFGDSTGVLPGLI